MALLPLAALVRRTGPFWGAHAWSVLVIAFCDHGLLKVRRVGEKFCLSLDHAAESSSPQNAETSTLKACAPQAYLRHVLGLLALLVFGTSMAFAQESPAPSPSPAKSVRISFLPPPLDGLISLGIYEGSGKLVRVLHREAELDDFTIGTDALSTTWDGKNDAGENLPPGKYHARGYMVADGDVEGVGYFFNDWVTDETSLRIKKMSAIAVENGVPLITVTILPDRTLTLVCNINAEVETTGEPPLPPSKCKTEPNPPLLVDPIACDIGRDRTTWTIDRLERGAAATEVKQLSAGKELLRRMEIPPTDPQPIQIAASKDTDTIVLLEENAAMQRLRSLTLVPKAGDKEHSDWKIDFEKKIVAHKDFTIENGKPIPTGGKAASGKITVKLPPNPLKHDKRESLELYAGFDEDGSFLKTADGLPLQSISETKHLTRVVLAAHGENEIDVFQDDDAVLEQFRISEIDQMMSFDCGEIELN